MDFFTTNSNEIKIFARLLTKYTDDSQYSEFLSKVYKNKAKLISNYLLELVENKAGDNAKIAINNLGGQVESIVKTTVDRTKEKLETDIDTLINFLGQVAQEMLLREERGTAKAAIAILNYFFYSEDRTDEEKYLGLYFTAKLPLIIYAEIMNEQKLGVGVKLTEVETRVNEINEQLSNLEQSKLDVKKLADELSDQKVTFNFLGLSAAFDKFHKEKQISQQRSL